MTPDTAHVLSVFTRATPAQISEGMRWYLDAHEFALSLHPDIRKSAGVIAALSPQMHWESNKRAAAKVFANGTAFGTHTSDNEVKVDAILAGVDPTTILGQGKGRKVISFYHNIVDPTSFSIPTIDRHAFDIAVNEPGAYINRNGARILQRKGMYETFGMVYVNAAREMCIGAPQMQAVTWVVWRSEKGIK